MPIYRLHSRTRSYEDHPGGPAFDYQRYVNKRFDKHVDSLKHSF